MKKIKLLGIAALALGFSFAGQAQTCKINSPFSFSVYAKDTINVSNSDFQGLSGAGNQMIIEQNFFLGRGDCGLSASVGNFFSGRKGHASGAIEITSPTGSYDFPYEKNGYPSFSAPGVYQSNSVNHASISNLVNEYSRFYAGLPSTGVKVSNLSTVSAISFQLGRNNVEVVTVNAAAVNSKNIRIAGKPGQTLVLNILGSKVELLEMQMTVVGIYADHIFINMPEATEVVLANIGGSNTTIPNGNPAGSGGSMELDLGLQGFIFAPNATVFTRSHKITGALFAKNVMGKINAGQINRLPHQGSSPCLELNSPACGGKVTPPTERPLN